MQFHNSSFDVAPHKEEIRCYRYTMPIVYGEKECYSRYGEDAPFLERRHNIIAVFPIIEDESPITKGLLYSFLPTQIKTNAPIILHVPFKLDGSREFVDPQGENAWFNYTRDNLIDFIKAVYSANMYRSASNTGKCFCQMCQEKFDIRYIERNDIEKNPAYAWEQMYLCLCLHCSKDYILLRHNDVVWGNFIDQIMSANVLENGVIEIPIADRTIAFTATHLAEVQEIFKAQGWGDKAPKREPIIGQSEENEEDPD